MKTDELYMQRCIDLAGLGLGKTAPNPMVGAVIVHNERIIGEGYHRRAGEAHAEVNAINAVEDKGLLADSTLYVNLEPCCHHGKTPPCTDSIIKYNIPRVVIGTADPFDAVAGKGIARLRSKGCQVDVGVMKDQCRKLNRRFFTFHEKKRPYIILKWAQTADAFIDIDRPYEREKRPTWITSEKLRVLVHKWRSEEIAIMVGTNTALKDNPRLNVRDWYGTSPLRIVLDQHGQLPPSLSLKDNTHTTWIFNEKTDHSEKNTHHIRIPFNDQLLENIVSYLYKEGIQSLFVEGGQTLLQSLIDRGLWDEARIFSGSQFFGSGVAAPQIHSNKTSKPVLMGEERFYLIKKS